MKNIIVTGTKGKTSITAFLDKILSDYRRLYISTYGISENGKLKYDNDYMMKKYKKSSNVSGYLFLEKIFNISNYDYLIGEASYSVDFIVADTFLKSNIDVGVITNVYFDHINGTTIKNQNDLKEAKKFVLRNLKKGGTLVLPIINCEINKNCEIRNEIPKDVNLLTVGFEDEDFLIKNKKIYFKGKEILDIGELKFAFNGLSDIINLNIGTIIATLYALGFDFNFIKEKLKSIDSFNDITKGRLNRFKVGDNIVYLDFAHEEESLKAIIDLIKKYEKKGITISLRFSYSRPDDIIIKTTQIISKLVDNIYIYDKAVSSPKYRQLYTQKYNRKLEEVGKLMYETAKKIKGLKKVKYVSNEYECLKKMIEDNNGKNVILHIVGDDIDKTIKEIKNQID